MPRTSAKISSITWGIVAPSLLVCLLTVLLYQRVQGSLGAPPLSLQAYADIAYGITYLLACICLLQSVLLTWAHARALGALQEQGDRREQAELSQAAEAMQHYAIFMLDPRGYVASWDRDGERLLGYQIGDVTGRHISLFYGDADSRQGKPAHDLATATVEGRSDDDCWMVRKDGFKFRASVSIVAIRDPGGNLCGFTNVVREHVSDSSDSPVGSQRS